MRQEEKGGTSMVLGYIKECTNMNMIKIDNSVSEAFPKQNGL